jgi:hypothetical protein
MYEPPSERAMELIASLKLPKGNSIATLSDLGWAVRADGEAVLARHAIDPRTSPGGPCDLALQIATMRLLAGGMLMLDGLGPIVQVATWYSTRVIELLLGQTPRYHKDNEPGEVDIQGRIAMGHADLAQRYRWRSDGRLFVFDPDDTEL